MASATPCTSSNSHNRYRCENAPAIKVMSSTPRSNEPQRIRSASGQRDPVLTSRPPSATKRTCPSTPKFATADRAALRRFNSGGSEQKVAAAAPAGTAPPGLRPPCRRFILESPTVGVKKEKPRSPTKPIPFKLLTDERAASSRAKSESDNDHTDDLAKYFKALPLPSLAPAPLPPKKLRPVTIPQPFPLKTERIDAEMKEKRRKMEEKEREERKKAEFRALPMPDFNRPVFCPVLAEKRHTEVENFQLSTDVRAAERKRFEEQKRKKEEEYQEILRQREFDKHRREEEELRKLRAETVHQAQPFKNPKPFEVKHDTTQFTVPHTPKFHSDRRLFDRPPSRNGMY